MCARDEVPPRLKSLQHWFGGIIGRPLDQNNDIEAEAAEYIAPSHSLEPQERIQIYNQQYWWRLLNVLHEAFPLLVRVFGYRDFNRQIAIPYLVRHPPRHWSLFLIGDRLPAWIEREYGGPQQALALDAANVDWAFCHSFIEADLPPLTSEQLPSPQHMERLLDKRLYAQPHLHLLKTRGDLFHFRAELLAHPPEYWQHHPLPNLDAGTFHFFALYRNRENHISWKTIVEGEYALLQRFKTGASIDQVCEWLEGQSEGFYQAAMEQLHIWFQEWTARGFLSLEQK